MKIPGALILGFLVAIEHSSILNGKTCCRRGIAALATEGGTKQCIDPLTRAKVREFSLVKTSRRGSESGSKRRRGEDSSILSGATREKTMAAGQNYVIYKAVLDCEGIELRAKVSIRRSIPILENRPLKLYLWSIWAI